MVTAGDDGSKQNEASHVAANNHVNQSSGSDSQAGPSAPQQAAPKGLGLGLSQPKGLGSGLGALPPKGGLSALPAKPSTPKRDETTPINAPTSSATSAPSSAPAGLGAALPKPAPKAAGAMPTLPPRNQSKNQQSATPASADGGSTAVVNATAVPASGAGAMPSLPPRSQSKPPASAPADAAHTAPTPVTATITAAAGAMPSAPPARAAAPTPSGPALPARPGAGGPPARPTLPMRPGMGPPGAMPGRPPMGPPLGGHPTLPGLLGQPPRPAGMAGPIVGAVTAAGGEVINPDETRKIRNLQRQAQELRVSFLRAVMRIGLRPESDSVPQYLNLMDRIEKMAGQNLYKQPRNANLVPIAIREAAARENADPTSTVMRVKLILMGVTGTGKSSLLNVLLGRNVARASAVKGGTKRIRTYRGQFNGIRLEIIDTPGLQASITCGQNNRQLLRTIRAVKKRAGPNCYPVWVDRADMYRAGLGDMPVLQMVTEVMGAAFWQTAIVVMTHAHAAAAAMGREYNQFMVNRKNIMNGMIRQACQAMGPVQMRAAPLLVDCHPECPVNNLRQLVVQDQGVNVAWRQQLMLLLISFTAVDSFTQLFKNASKAKAAAKPTTQQDLLRRLMMGTSQRAFPAIDKLVGQMVEGVLAADEFPALPNLKNEDLDDEAVNDFDHKYYPHVFRLARKGVPEAQKEYALLLNKEAKLRRAYKIAQRSGEDRNVEANGPVTATQLLNINNQSFDPTVHNVHRYVINIPELEGNVPRVMPTLQYNSYEHEDGITGFVLEKETLIGAQNGFGGVPFELSMALEKDKSSFCVQADTHITLLHSAMGRKRHCTQIVSSCEVLRPQLTDVLYQLEINTFKDGLLRENDHAGAGVLMVRLGENGRLDKGSTAYGVRVQDNFRVGPFGLGVAAARVTGPEGGAGQDSAWGGRCTVNYDWLPGVACRTDWYQTLDKDGNNSVPGIGAAFSYEGKVGGTTYSADLDITNNKDVMHLNVNLSRTRDYNLAWLLLIPAVNYIKAMWSSFSAGAGEEEMEEGEEEEGMGEEFDGEDM